MIAWKLIVTFLLLERFVSYVGAFYMRRRLALLVRQRASSIASLDRRLGDAEAVVMRALGNVPMRSPSGRIYAEGCSCPSCTAARAEGPGVPWTQP